jgi:Leucine-rich repeat (LRR) protein
MALVHFLAPSILAAAFIITPCSQAFGGICFSSHHKEEISDAQKLINKIGLDGKLNLAGQLKSPAALEKFCNTLPELAQCSELKSLDLRDNNMTQVPEALGQLTQLEELFLSFNKIKILPDNLGNLVHLKKLYIGYNKISVLPDSLSNLENLTEIYMRNNRFSMIPETLIQLNDLKKIDLIKNDIQNIPIFWATQPELHISLDNCPLQRRFKSFQKVLRAHPHVLDWLKQEVVISEMVRTLLPQPIAEEIVPNVPKLPSARDFITRENLNRIKKYIRINCM